MIVSFRDEWLRTFFVEDVGHGTFRPISKAACFGSSR